jgi:hypothetical protein
MRLSAKEQKALLDSFQENLSIIVVLLLLTLVLALALMSN